MFLAFFVSIRTQHPLFVTLILPSFYFSLLFFSSLFFSFCTHITKSCLLLSAQANNLNFTVRNIKRLDCNSHLTSFVQVLSHASQRNLFMLRIPAQNPLSLKSRRQLLNSTALDPMLAESKLILKSKYKVWKKTNCLYVRQ